MNKKFEKFADEMLKEVKDLKDLTKKELPIVAQEYVRYNKISSLVGVLFTGSIFAVSAWSVYHGATSDFGHRDDGRGYILVGGIFGLLSGIAFMCCSDQYLSFKFQPRRMAIYAITSLFK